MYTNLNTLIAESAANDPSWKRATEICARRLHVPTHVWQLFKNCWQGNAEVLDFYKVMGFSKLRPAALIDAAQINLEGGAIDSAKIDHAIQNLGIRLSAVVLAVNHSCRATLEGNPPRVWRPLFERMMTNIEIGYRLGGKSYEIGVEAGALIGFATMAGQALLLAENPRGVREWCNATQNGEARQRDLELELFGCEPGQIAALVMQMLGFGHETAVGVACGACGLDSRYLNLSREAQRWRNIYLWIDALAHGRSYPAQLEVRNFFSELAPPVPGGHQSKNLLLDVLYTEVAKIKSRGSYWTWHLPRPGYDETMAAFEAAK